MILDITILLAAAVAIVPLFRLARLGIVPGFLVAGILVGPSGLALIDNVAAFSRLSELGIVLLLFVIGSEIKDAAGAEALLERFRQAYYADVSPVNMPEGSDPKWG